MTVPAPLKHFVNGRPLAAPFPHGLEQLILGMGCFWGAEKRFWDLPGVYVTAAGYAGGHAANPSYDDVCGGGTGCAEVVRVVYDPLKISREELLKVFWESHDPTQGMRQGNDQGTQYRSCLYAGDEATLSAALASRDAYQEALTRAGKGRITTEIRLAPPFHCAEAHHQQYLAKHPEGYCGLGGTGVACPACDSRMPSRLPGFLWRGAEAT